MRKEVQTPIGFYTDFIIAVLKRSNSKLRYQTRIRPRIKASRSSKKISRIFNLQMEVLVFGDGLIET